ncbi:DedA family protein [Aquihabitans daechungensis]|uniref:DedA family protein n=1 Tax=Aquihabitans daechungensis TaxID=1052257 RepID=UPI003B9F62EF
MEWFEVGGWFDGLRDGSPVLILGLLAAVAFLETSTLGGLLVPGEVVLLMAGALAQEGAVHPGAVVAAALVAALVGDAIGYALGGRMALHLPGSRLERFVGARRIASAHDYLEQHGPSALVLGRFVGVTRSVLPTIAGGAGLRFRRFFAWDLAAVVLYSFAAVGAGYAAGASWDRVASTVSRWTPAVFVGFAAVAVALRLRRRLHRSAAATVTPAPARAEAAPPPAPSRPCGLH